MSAIEKLRESLSDNRAHIASHIAELARAVLAEHDAAQSKPPSELAKAWRERARTAIGAAGGWSSECYHIIEEAVLLMSRAEPVAEAPKRLRAGWRKELTDAMRSLRYLPGDSDALTEAWRNITFLLNEAEASAAPEPDNTPINDWMVKVANLRLELQRANAIIDALLRKP